MTTAQFPANTVEFSMPEDWRRVDLPGGIGFAPAADLDAVQGQIECAQLTLYIQALNLESGQAFEDAIEALMGRRVRQGYPGRFQSEVAGVPARGFDWTDGVANILSFFVRAPNQQLLEFSVSRASFPGFGPRLEDVAAGLLRRVTWSAVEPRHRAGSSKSASEQDGARWEVWRQDDNGNRYLVSAGHDRLEAEAICVDFEARGHKQTYWAVATRDDAG